MFFNFGSVVHDSEKLARKRLLSKKLLLRSLEDSLSYLEEDTFFDEDSLLVVELRVVNVEDYVLENFSF